MSGHLVPEALVFGAIWLWLLALLPAAVVTLLKGRWLLFAAGWLTFGITWLLGAIPLAEANSGWARRFYGEQRLARADNPRRHPRPGRTTALWLGGTAALVLSVGLLTARPAPIVGVDGSALQSSVGGSALDHREPCRHEEDDTWICAAYEAGDSSGIPYRVRMGGLGCWTAVPDDPASAGSPERLAGCITVWDQVRPFDRLL